MFADGDGLVAGTAFIVTNLQKEDYSMLNE
jgi:hypothetical protein